MKKILLLMAVAMALVSCGKSIDKYAEETLDGTFVEFCKKKGITNKYELSDKNIVYKSDSLCIIEFNYSESYNGRLIQTRFEYIVSRGYKSPYRMQEGRFEKRVIRELYSERKSSMEIYKENCEYLHDKYESERIDKGVHKDEYYCGILYGIAHSQEGDFMAETEIR